MNKEFIIPKVNLNLCLSRKNQTNGINQQCNHLKHSDCFCKFHSKKWHCSVFEKPDNISQKKYNNFIKIKNTPIITHKDYIQNHDILLKVNINILKKNLKYYKQKTTGKKQILLDRLQKYYDNYTYYYLNQDIIVKLQKSYKKKLRSKEAGLRGEGFLNKNRIINKEDFFTLENINTIEDKYFFSYNDNNFIYGFDIRTFKKLIDKNMNNPYTRNPVPLHVKEKLKKIYNKLKIKEIKNEPKLNSQQKMNMEVIKIFQYMDELNLYAGGLNINWFLNLSLIDIKKFYKNLEDIWNYRAQISQTIKYNIIGNNNVFNTSVYDYYDINSLKKCRVIILKNMETLLINGIDNSSKYLGGLYILTGLCSVSKSCAESMPWLLN